MANPKKRLPQNKPGDFFVDETCIDCDTCRILAPKVFAESGEYSYVQAQPRDLQETRRTLQALLACPTHSIGTEGDQKATLALGDFPLKLDERIFYLGYAAEASFGARSYLLKIAEGYWMIESPRWNLSLVKSLHAWGGLKGIFLSHQDDVADADRYAREFGAKRVIHQLELKAQPDAEEVLQGKGPWPLEKGMEAIFTPGHSAGHCSLWVDKTYLFSGDHLWYSRSRQDLGASKEVCWYDWPTQIESMEKLLNIDFEWVLPGHGRWFYDEKIKMKERLQKLIIWMKKQV
ncbi:MAG: MBL fold metallo-hydrolase [Deltaproteobacteria bacterium]|nr:MBL fold metallo-hydrolase [Deltaproteobacteria bacterium]